MNKRICTVIFAYYPMDPRARRGVEALVDAGFEMDLICLRNQDEAPEEIIHGVHTYRLPLQKKRGSKLRYLWEYFAYFVLAFFKLSWLFIRKRYRIVHVNNMPDFLVFSALIPRLFGCKVVLDLQDPMPEVFIAKYNMKPSHWLIRTLRVLEKLSATFANEVLTANIAFEDLFVRSCKREKQTILMNSPDESIFTPQTPIPAKNKEKFIVMFHGTIVERNGLGDALYAINKIKDKISGLEFHVYGEGDFVSRFLDIKQALQLDDVVFFHGYTLIEDIAEALKGIDLGVIPNKRSPFTEINLPTRIFECLRMGKPVIAPDTRGIRDYFGSDDLFFFNPDEENSLADTILRAYESPALRDKMVENGLKVCEPHWWETEKQVLINMDKRLMKLD